MPYIELVAKGQDGRKSTLRVSFSESVPDRDAVELVATATDDPARKVTVVSLGGAASGNYDEFVAEGQDGRRVSLRVPTGPGVPDRIAMELVGSAVDDPARKVTVINLGGVNSGVYKELVARGQDGRRVALRITTGPGIPDRDAIDLVASTTDDPARGVTVVDLGGGGAAPEIILFVGDSETAGRAQGSWSLEPTLNAYSDGTARTWDWLTNAFVSADDINSYQSLTGGVTPATKSMVKPWCWRRAQAIGATVYGINCGWGGTSTAQWLSGDTSTTVGYFPGGANLVNVAIARANAARAAFPTATFKIVMYIGANDATAALYGGAGALTANILATIATLRAGITGAANAEVYVWAIPDYPVANPYAANWTPIRNELIALENVPNKIYVLRAYRGWTWELAGVHPEALGYEDAAIRGANRMAGAADAYSTITAPNSGQVPNLHDWLDPSQGRTPVGVGAISQWVDAQSGIIYTQATGADQPSYSSGYSSLNNAPAITALTAAGARLDAGAGDVAKLKYWQGTADATIFIVVDVDALNSDGYIITTTPGTATAGVRVHKSGTTFSFDIYRAAGTAYAAVGCVTPTATGKHCFEIRLKADGTLKGRCLDTTWTYNTPPSYNGSPSTADHSIPRIGRNSTTNFPFVGAIGEILAYDRALTDYECMRVREYLRAKFDLVAA